MVNKTYTAKSIQEALGRIKEELGPDAMILSTRRLPRSPRNPYGPELFEVSAGAGDPSENVDDWLDPRLRPESQTLPDSLEDGSTRETGSWQEMKAQLLTIQEMLLLLNQSGGLPDLLRLHPQCLNLYARLVRSGISERRVYRILQKAGAFSDDTPSAEAVARRVMQGLMEAIEVSDPFAVNGQRCLAAFIGPTGVGKTTTLAKLAADLNLRQKRRVGIVSIDSYRIGAFDQLKAYASIMGLACLPAFSRQDLEVAVSRLQDRDVILIDTAGQSHLDHDRMAELGRLMAGGLPIACHLTLSTPTRREDMLEAAKRFALLNPVSYIFTKVDETRQRGNIIDQIQDAPLPISFITNGQAVPEDIVLASRKKIIDLVLSPTNRR
jgi:flagellar biosynthesis protein FlhF